MNFEIEVKPRNKKHVDLLVFTKRKFEPLPVSNNQISLKLFAPLTSFSIERMTRMRVPAGEFTLWLYSSDALVTVITDTDKNYRQVEFSSHADFQRDTNRS